MRRTITATMGALALALSLGASPASADQVDFTTPAESCVGAESRSLIGTCVVIVIKSTKPGKSRHDT